MSLWYDLPITKKKRDLFPMSICPVHAAIIAINEAIDQQIPLETVAALQNPAAHLVNIMTDLAVNYQDTLFDAKETKAEVARNKVLLGLDSYHWLCGFWEV